MVKNTLLQILGFFKIYVLLNFHLFNAGMQEEGKYSRSHWRS